MLFFSAAASNCVKGRETRKQPLALHRYKTSLIWSWCTLLLPFPPPTLVLCIPVAQNLLASPSPDFKTYNTRSSLNTWEGRTLLFPPPLINIQQKHQSLSRSLRLHGCSSPCHKAVCTRLCVRGSVHEAVCTRLCARGSVYEALCTRLCVRATSTALDVRPQSRLCFLSQTEVSWVWRSLPTHIQIHFQPWLCSRVTWNAQKTYTR